MLVRGSKNKERNKERNNERNKERGKFVLFSLGIVHDKEEPGRGHSLFTHNQGLSSNSYYDPNFEPEYDITPEIPENV